MYACCERLLVKGVDGQRLEVAEGLHLLEHAPLPALGEAATAVRDRLHPDRVMTFVVDRNINYTNVCVTKCSFCAFYRPPRHPEGYVLTHEQILDKVRELVEIGGTQVLIQGGHHHSLPFSYYTGMIRAIREHFPQVDVHSFSPSEVVHFSRMYRMSVRQVLEELKAAGLHSLPGGGAEILVDRVRKIIAPLKTTWRQWVDVMLEAHSLGLKGTATMMYGHVETLEERIVHLDRVRQAQDETGGMDQGVFRAFSAWSFQNGPTPLQVERPASSFAYLRLMAVARLYLDNIRNIQASWVTQGPKVGQLSLAYGCNDMGGTMMEENVVRAAGTAFRLDKETIVHLVHAAGYDAAQRNTRYEILRLYPRAEAARSASA